MQQNFIIPKVEDSCLLFIDMQERLISAMPSDISETIRKQQILLDAMKILNMKVVITEQYPKGLGHTIGELSEHFDESWSIIEKSTFSALGEPEVRKKITELSLKTVVIAGIESHVCVLQSVIDSLEKGYQTILLTDAVNSRNSIDKESAFETAKSAGAYLMSVESLLFMLMRDAKHPAFKNVSKLLR